MKFMEQSDKAAQNGTKEANNMKGEEKEVVSGCNSTLKVLVYERKKSIAINNNPCDVWNFAAIDCLGKYFNDEYEGMESGDAMEIAESFERHYDGFEIRDIEEDVSCLRYEDTGGMLEDEDICFVSVGEDLKGEFNPYNLTRVEEVEGNIYKGKVRDVKKALSKCGSLDLFSDDRNAYVYKSLSEILI